MINYSTQQILGSVIAPRLTEYEELTELREDLRDYIKKLAISVLSPEEKQLIKTHPELVTYQETINLNYSKLLEQAREKANIEETILNISCYWIEKFTGTDYCLSLDIPFNKDEQIPVLFDNNNVRDEIAYDSVCNLIGEKRLDILLYKLGVYLKLHNSYLMDFNRIISFVEKNGNMNDLKIVYPELYKLYKDAAERIKEKES